MFKHHIVVRVPWRGTVNRVELGRPGGKPHVVSDPADGVETFDIAAVAAEHVARSGGFQIATIPGDITDNDFDDQVDVRIECDDESVLTELKAVLDAAPDLRQLERECHTAAISRFDDTVDHELVPGLVSKPEKNAVTLARKLDEIARPCVVPDEVKAKASEFHKPESSPKPDRLD